jgi:anti-sigma regulatory factor (Ser/Thr protein kinase)
MAPSATLTAPASQQTGTGTAARAGQWRFDLPLEHSTQAPARARHAAHRALAGLGVDADRLQDVLLVVSELVTNAVTHALPPVVLHLTLTAGGTGIRVRVTDGGPAPTPATWAAQRPSDEHGRGTGVMDVLTEAVGTDENPEGLIDHWADLHTA